ncbi:MAG TPA: helix-turn-helix domain-containing protein [Firmicutes bacterium]|nr:helix-turn-helix domain-containing protein [Bacillota bacterium]
MDTIGKRIKYARKKKKLTQIDIYKKTGISSGNLSDIENNKSYPSAQALISLNRELGVSIDWILTGRENVQNSFLTRESQNEYRAEELLPLTDQEKEMLWMYRRLDARDREDAKGIIEMKYWRSRGELLPDP